MDGERDMAIKTIMGISIIFLNLSGLLVVAGLIFKKARPKTKSSSVDDTPDTMKRTVKKSKSTSPLFSGDEMLDDFDLSELDDLDMDDLDLDDFD